MNAERGPDGKAPSPLRSMVRMMARGIQARGAPAAPDCATPRRKVALERSSIAIDPRRVQAYVRATGGEGIEAFGSARPTAPPFFAAMWETALSLEMFAGLEPPLPLGAFVHVSTDLVCARPMLAGDVVKCRVELERVERVRRGLRLTVLARNWLGAGQLCSQSTSVFQVRSDAHGLAADAPRAQVSEPEVPDSGWVELVRWDLPAGAGRRYARVSGDYNPIHLWGVTARPFGFRAPILHGYATAARAAHTLIEHCLHGDAAALRRMRIHFRAPLPLPSCVCFLVNDQGPRRWFRVAAPGEGPVYAEGSCGAADD